MYIADESVVISLDDLRYVAREDGNEILKLCYPEKTHALEFYTAEDRDAMFDFLVKRLVMDDRFIVPMPGKAEQIDKEKIGHLLEHALHVAFKHGAVNSKSISSAMSALGEYSTEPPPWVRDSDAISDLCEYLGIERIYLQE